MRDEGVGGVICFMEEGIATISHTFDGWITAAAEDIGGWAVTMGLLRR